LLVRWSFKFTFYFVRVVSINIFIRTIILFFFFNFYYLTHRLLVLVFFKVLLSPIYILAPVVFLFRKTVLVGSFEMSFNACDEFVLMFSKLSKWCLVSTFLNFGNKKKLGQVWGPGQGSREAGRGHSSDFWQNWWIDKAEWAGALSWWRNHELFRHNSGFFYDFFHAIVAKRLHSTDGWLFDFEAKIQSAQFYWKKEKNSYYSPKSYTR